ncbi:hypothetical protein BC629DRAFT_1494726 [Irpex lacteus]|nr:hypothetical protein BC629DRAFT_1494726 [Irpex lacteus]
MLSISAHLVSGMQRPTRPSLSPLTPGHPKATTPKSPPIAVSQYEKRQSCEESTRHSVMVRRRADSS